MRFQVLFHSPPGVLFAFPSQYWFTIGRSRVFSLGGWSPHLQTGCHVSRPTYRLLSTTRSISRTGPSPSLAGLSRPFRCRTCYRSTGLPHTPMNSVCDTGLAGGFPHSEICGSKPVCRLPAAYRKLLRPSSPVIAKASTTYT